MKQTIKVAIESERIKVGRYKQDDFKEGYKKELNGAEWIAIDDRRVFNRPEYSFEYDPKTSKLTVYKEIEVDI
jgi:hypothetical protein